MNLLKKWSNDFGKENIEMGSPSALGALKTGLPKWANMPLEVQL